MKICIFGIGRSGTTSLYSLLQKIMEYNFGDSIDYVYEPFMWDRDTFNRKYEHVSSYWPKVTSLYIDGLYHHQRLPLFINDFSQVEPASENFVKNLLTPREGKNHLLMKSIRMNGRFEFFRQLNDDIKYIFIIRNPFDVVNSVLPIFSFFGEEKHKDDWPRFVNHIFQIYHEYPLGKDRIQKQFQYWYYMNRFFLENVKADSPDILLLSHEHFILDTQAVLRKICDFIEIAYSDQFLDFAKKRVGVSTKKIFLDAVDIKKYREYLDHYYKWIASFSLGPVLDRNKIIEKYHRRREETDAAERAQYAGDQTFQLKKALAALIKRDLKLLDIDELKGEDSVVLDIAKTLFMLNEYEAAAYVFNKTLEKAQNVTNSTYILSSLFYLGLCYVKTADAKSAAHYFQRCLELEPGHQEAAKQLELLKTK